MGSLSKRARSWVVLANVAGKREFGALTGHAKRAREEGGRCIPRDLTRANFPFPFESPEVEKRIRGNILPVSFYSLAY